MPSKIKKYHQSAPLKKSYSSPLLTHFGAIQEITSGGSGLETEGGMAMPDKKP